MEAFEAILGEFTRVAEAGDAEAFAALFTEDGEYDDVFYGVFRGRVAIAEMMALHFHGNARDFRWQMDDPVCQDGIGYAHYTFSYTSTMKHSAGQRAVFTGCAQFKLSRGRIRAYREWAFGLAGLSQLGAPADLLARQAGRESGKIRAAADPAVHLHSGA